MDKKLWNDRKSKRDAQHKIKRDRRRKNLRVHAKKDNDNLLAWIDSARKLVQ